MVIGVIQHFATFSHKQIVRTSLKGLESVEMLVLTKAYLYKNDIVYRIRVSYRGGNLHNLN